MTNSLRIAALASVLCFTLAARAATYYVDYEGGSDEADGISPAAAFKHAPGDPQAAANARKTALAPGDTVIFKGGVRYLGTIRTASGSQSAPVLYDGNVSGGFGEGPAVIDGSVPLSGWRKCLSSEQAGGNPNWRKLWYNYVPGGCDLFSLNLCQGERMLNLAQYPNPGDEFFYDLLADWHPTVAPYVQRVSHIRITPGKGTGVNGGRPLLLAADGDLRSSAVLENMADSTIRFDLPEPRGIVAIGLANLPNYAAVSRFEILSGDKVLLTGELAHEAGLQRFELPEPVTLDELTFRSLAMHPADHRWGAIAEIQAYDADGENVLLARPSSIYTDAEFLDQDDPHHWDNATVMLYAKPATTYFQRVTGFDPQAHRLSFEVFMGQIYASRDGRIALINAPRAIDTPGEWAIMEEPEPDGRRLVLLWPQETDGDDLPEIRYSRPRPSSANSGFLLGNSRFVTIQGFVIERFAGRGAGGVSGSRCANVLVRNCEIRQLAASGRSSGIGISDGTNIILQSDRIHHNRRCSAVVLSRCEGAIVRDCFFDTNGSTALDYYGCRDSKILSNTVARHKGVHANGLTMYLGCRNILVEGNTVFGGNVALTAQDGSDITIVNNVLDGGETSSVVGLWRGKPLTNVYLYNNLIVRGMNNDWCAALYCDNPIAGDFVIRNNVIDGLSINRGAPVRDHNIYTHPGIEGDAFELHEGERLVEDMKDLFVNPAMMDYRPRPDSPAIDAGVEIEGRFKDFRNTPVPAGKAPDIGPFEYRAKPW